jgi:putative NADH-flavin reductase
MKLTIFAATGGIGRHALEQAIDAGHEVTAVVRNPSRLSREVPSFTVDLTAPDQATLQAAIKGTDAVLSGLGPRSPADAGITWQGTQAIIEAMKATNVRRIVTVSAAPIGTVPSPGRPNPPKHDPGDGIFMRTLFSRMAKLALRNNFADLARMEDLLAGSGLDWTVVRPPRLSDKPLTGTYRTAVGQNVRSGFVISRADVAHEMLAVLENPDTLKQTIGLAN